ncbi:glutathione S-transferase family protein [Limimaricola cinnabarinus]|uniref:glutathione S-transferase family protein n=1 Tax=Limimaricola cinnabarinus TaxID=1125964 RepID=UPI0024911901|nr:glutathione binding-like protein [Limimaricola cinnabarinus]
MSRPDILLYTANTMNGWKPLIFLHEAEIDYELRPVDLGRREQKSPKYLALNPNGRIPTIVDRGNDDFAVFESGAILWYLAEKYDRFLSHDPKERSETMQWLMFQMGGVGPMMGQAMFFQRIAKPNGTDVPYAIARYVNESRRLLEVLDRRLAGRDWLVGDALSIADIATYPWARSHFWATVSVEGLPNLQGWLNRLDAMPRVQAALQLPEPRPSAFGEGDIEAAARDNAARFKEQ